MFRGSAAAFSTDALARDVARGAVAHGYDIQIGGAGRLFFYMPFQHNEAVDEQKLSVSLLEGAGDAKSQAFTREPYAMIERLRSFPHTKAAQGRAYDPGNEEARKHRDGKSVV